MITIESAFSQEERRLGIIGRQGENNTRQIAFDCEDILAEYPAAQIICAMQRTTDKEAYLADSTMQDKTLIVTMSDADVSIPGTLRVELRAIIGEDIRKSAVYMAQVVASLIGQGDKPGNPVPDSLNRIDETLKSAEETQEKLERSLAQAETVTSAASDAAQSAREVADTVQAKLDNGDFVGPAGKDGEKGPKGDTGATGPQGVPGSDAEVTTENIEAALGYAPAKVPQSVTWGIINNVNGEIALNPASNNTINSRATRQPITAGNFDYAVKVAMCDGKGAAWTEAEQKAARERMGVDKLSELTEDLKHTADNTGLGDKTIILDSWDSGGYNAEGTYVTSDKIKIKDLIPVSKGQTYTIKYNGQTAMDVVRYTSDDFSGGQIINWGVSADITHTMANDYYIGIALRTSNLGAVKPVIAQKNVIALVKNVIGNTAYTPPMIQGGTSSADGSLVARNDRICTKIKYRTEDVLSISIGDKYQFLLAQYNDSGDFLGNTSWRTTIEKSSITGSDFRVTVRANNGSNILPNATTGLTINLESQSTTDLLLKLYDDQEERKADDADLKNQISDIKAVVIADSIGINQIARLGWKPYAGYFPPEQSLASYKLAYNMGMRMLLADVRKTSDNVLVCFHDASINSTARNSDGTTISQTINITDHTLAELNAYDYGIYKGYSNEGILTLDAFLKLCGQINCVPILETKIWLLAEEVNSIVTMVRKYGLQDGFIWAEMPESTIATRTCTIIRQKLPNATVMIRGGAYSNDALSTAVAFSGADKKTILSFTDYAYITAETVATCRENNIDIEYSMVSTEADMDALYANSAFGDIRYIVCSEFNVHNYIINKIGLTS